MVDGDNAEGVVHVHENFPRREAIVGLAAGPGS